MAKTTRNTSEEESVIEATISVQPRGKSVAVYTIDHGGILTNGKIELSERHIRMVKRIILDFTSGKEIL
jgi:hypothetical protein